MENKDKYINAIDNIKASEELKKETIYKLNQKRPQKLVYKLANAMAVILVLLGIIFITDEVKVKNTLIPETSIKKQMNLPTIGNEENLLKLIKDNKSVINTNSGFLESADAMNDTTKKAQSIEKSDTNVQVEGIDEGDIVKTDGKYIYYISKGKLVITTTGDNFKILKEISYETKNQYSGTNPIELYIDKDKLSVIISYSEYTQQPYSYKQYTKVIEYDLSNINDIKVYKEFEIEGAHISSRLYKGILYLVTNKYLRTYNIDNRTMELQQTYKDTTDSNETKTIALTDVCYIPNMPGTSYINIISLDIHTKRSAKIETILGNVNTVYMSEDNIYLAGGEYAGMSDALVSIDIAPSINTKIYKFKIDNTNMSYVATTEIDGNLINQFAMDEYNGNLRIAVTKNRYNNEESINGVYILNQNLETIGKLDELAKGERIYSVRFDKERVYLVTFKQVDPLFVIDLSKADSPKVLGELKIPGYSTYLHPYDENYIIGFGEDTKVTKDSYGSERVITTGIKMAMFDIKDVNNPKELFSTKIGKKGTYSELLYNHKSLLFSKERNILAFPISISENDDAKSRNNLEFQGAVVYSIDMEKGFIEKGRIAHMNKPAEKYNNYGYNSEYYENLVERIIYVDNSFYTLSPGKIKRTDIKSMKQLSEVKIEVTKGNEYILY